MKLKRLEVFGFKSFADRTEFAFEPGLTGIVGPNGCGKSNVVDAIKWVLGETRPTSLRGSEMEDVIFKGTASRAPLGYADVSLVLDNSDGSMEGLSEVSFTRRFFRTGEGEYLVNRETVRRKDLKGLLFDTGLGVNAYSVMEQGKIDAILSANAVDRRAIFEEAAGITRFRFDRRESLRRLETTEKNLESAKAVLAELERQRNSLAAQASRARRHQALTADLRGWRAAIALARYLERLAERDRAAADVRRCEAQESAAREARARAEEDARLARDEARTFQSEETRLVADVSALKNEEARCGERASSLRQQAAALLESSQSKTKHRAQLEGERGEIESGRGEAARTAREQESRVAEADATLERCVGEARLANDAYRAAGRALEDAQRALLEAIESRASAQNAQLDLEAEERSTRHQEERLAKRTAELDAEIPRLETDHASAQTRADETGRRMAELRTEEGRIRTARDAAASSLAEGESRLSEIERRVAGLQSRVSVLRSLETELAGVGAGAKALLASRLPGVGGLLADRVRADLDVAPALEAALGRRAGAIVVDTRETAAAAIAFLRDKKAGRAALVVSGGDADAIATAPAIEGPGVLGRLLDRVTVDPTVARATRALLANVVLVETLADATRALAANPALTFVTRTGERVDAGGVSGGSAEPTATPISRRSSLAALDAELAGARDERSRHEALRERAHLAVLQAKSDEARCANGSSSASREAMEASLALARAHDRLDRLRNERSLLEAEAAELASRRADLAGRRVALDGSLEGAVAAVSAASEAQSRLEAEKKRAEAERDGAAQTESQARVEAANRRASQERLLGELARATDALARAADEAARLEREASDESARAAQATDEARAIEQSIAELVDRRAALDEKVLEIHERSRGRVDAADSAAAAERERTDELETVSRALTSARLAEQRAAMQCDEVTARAREEGAVSVTDFAAVFSPCETFDLAASEERMAEIRGKLERIGTVSSDATTELAAIETRFEELRRHCTDLEDARNRLRETIVALDLRCVEKFNEAFVAIREHFGELFRRLFRGGKADVRMQEGVDPLEAGIEIFAQPPGKKLQSITLLSGGERTLTAIALLFAAFKTRVSPFCVLDEVDAALDDANVERFLAMLTEFTGKTQFIVVTHHRRTMAACSALLGVTMPEQGVSQKVAVRFEDVEQIVPGAVRAAAATPVLTAATNGNGHDGSRDESNEPVVVLMPTAPVSETETVVT